MTESKVDTAAVDLAVVGRVALSALNTATAAAAIARLRREGMSDGGIADKLRTTVAIVREHRGGRSGADGQPTEAVGRELVKKRAAGLCEGCGLVDGQSWSHRIPKGNGGTWSASNGLWLCGTGTTGCHGWLEGDRRAGKALGWALTRRQNPANAPALIWHRSARIWALLDDLGHLTPTNTGA